MKHRKFIPEVAAVNKMRYKNIMDVPACLQEEMYL
jgi:hypothetical protein